MRNRLRAVKPSYVLLGVLLIIAALVQSSGIGFGLVGLWVAIGLLSPLLDRLAPLPATTEKPATYSRRPSSWQNEDALLRMDVAITGLVEAAQAINSVLEQQEGGATEQAEIISTMNQRMDGFLERSEQIKERSRRMTEGTAQTRELSGAGLNAVQSASEGIEEVRAQVLAIAKSIVTLAQLTRRVDTIISSVTEIATQSNLLALNASIEAARAGTQGRGFAVVAEEVRSLSQQSSAAARQVQTILADIQAAVESARQATDSGMQGVDLGATMTSTASESLRALVETATQSSEAMRAIYTTISAQAQDLDELGISVDRIDRIAQGNYAHRQTVRAVATNLGRLADDLQESMAATKDD